MNYFNYFYFVNSAMEMSLKESTKKNTKYTYLPQSKINYSPLRKPKWESAHTACGQFAYTSTCNFTLNAIACQIPFLNITIIGTITGRFIGPRKRSVPFRERYAFCQGLRPARRQPCRLSYFCLFAAAITICFVINLRL